MHEHRQKFKKVTALFLILCMLFILLPPGKARAEDTEIIPQTYVDDSFDVNAIAAYEPEGDSKILNYVHPEVFAAGDHIARLKQEETLSTYAFLNRDGTRTVYYLDEAVKYTAADGSIREKDLTLTAAMNGYQTTENDIGLHMAQNPAAGIRIAYNNKQITLLPQDGSGEGTLSGNTVRYEDYYGPGTALVYTPTLSGVKEEIILSSYTGQNEFVFYINTGGLTMYPSGDRYYLAQSKTSDSRIWLGQIEVFDSNLKPCKGNMTALTILQGQRYKLTITVDEGYLTAPDTCYPVTVDPTLTVSDNTHGAGAIQDAPIYEGYPTSNFGSYQYNRAGYVDSSFKRGRTAVKLTGLLNHEDYIDSTAADITSAQFYMAEASGTSNVSVMLRALDSNSTWTESNVTWNNVGGTASTIYANIAPPGGGFGCFDITQLVKAWKNGSYSSGRCGFILMGGLESSKDKALYSSEHTTTSMRPYVAVTFPGNTAKTVNITNTAISVSEGTTKTLAATTSPSGLTVTWTSSNPSVATVSSSGVVTGLKAGTATITASVTGGGTDACTVYVVKTDGVYTIQNVASGYYLDGGGANIAQDNLTNISQKTRNNNTLTPDYLSQEWKIKYLSSGLYSIRPMHKLDMGLHGTTSDVSLKSIGTTDSMNGVLADARWSISYKTNGFVLKSNNDQYKTLSPLLGSTAANATIAAVSHSASSTAQRWTLSKLTAPHSGILLYDLDTLTIAGPIRKGVAINHTYTPEQFGFCASAYAGSDLLPTIYWESSNEAIATVNNAGAVTGVSAGTATISGALTADGEPEIEYTVVISALPISGYELPYQPDSWNAISSELNCYMYAIDNQTYDDGEWGGFQQPGMYAELLEYLDYYTYTSQEDLLYYVRQDFAHFAEHSGRDVIFQPIGKYDVCPPGTYKVALVINNPNTYHWYRQDPDGYWSHKPGEYCVSRVDDSNNLISDPAVADDEYENFVGYFAVTPWQQHYTIP